MNNSNLEIELAQKGARFNPLELSLPEEMPMQEWADIGRKLVRSDQVLKWWLGDWAAFGVRKYGQLKEFAEANSINYQTLRKLAYVSGAVELFRRRNNVEWSIHAEVAALKPREQVKWLEKVSAEGLPRVELRRQIRQTGGTQNALESDGPVTKFITKACDDLIHWLNSRPSEFWTDDRKAMWRARLNPLVKIFEAL